MLVQRSFHQRSWPASQPKGTLGAGDTLAHSISTPQSVVDFYVNFTDLGRISARFAAQLVHAGALTALEALAAKALLQSGEAHDLGLNASAVRDAGQACLAVFAQSVPQVRRRGRHAGTFVVATCSHLELLGLSLLPKSGASFAIATECIFAG